MDPQPTNATPNIVVYKKIPGSGTIEQKVTDALTDHQQEVRVLYRVQQKAKALSKIFSKDPAYPDNTRDSILRLRVHIQILIHRLRMPLAQHPPVYLGVLQQALSAPRVLRWRLSRWPGRTGWAAGCSSRRW